MKRKLTAVELFAGGGGLLLGVEQAGFAHLAACEWEHNCCETIRKNQSVSTGLFSGMKVLEGDVRSVDWGFLPEEVDLLAGGPPCQPFSLGGLARAALDERDMFPAFTEALATLKPRAFIVENVKGLVRPAFADYFNYILLRLQHPCVRARNKETWRDHFVRLQAEHTSGIHEESLRYEVTYHVVDAADYGVPQHRHRVFIIGFRSDVEADWAFPRATHGGHACNVDPGLHPWRTLGEALADLPAPCEKGQGDEHLHDHVFQGGAKAYPGHTGSMLNAPAKALKAGVHGVPGGENMIRFGDGTCRYLTVLEAKRVQTFPDWYCITGAWGEAMRQLGNAVPVALGRVIAKSVYDALCADERAKENMRMLDGSFDVGGQVVRS